MATVILIYLLIGWIIGFGLTIYHSFLYIRSDFDEEIIPFILLCILYWPWVLSIIVYHFSKIIIKKLKDRSK